MQLYIWNLRRRRRLRSTFRSVKPKSKPVNDSLCFCIEWIDCFHLWIWSFSIVSVVEKCVFSTKTTDLFRLIRKGSLVASTLGHLKWLCDLIRPPITKLVSLSIFLTALDETLHVVNRSFTPLPWIRTFPLLVKLSKRKKITTLHKPSKTFGNCWAN